MVSTVVHIPPLGTAPGGGGGDLIVANPQIIQLSMPTAGTEYSQSLTGRYFRFKSRLGSTVKLSYTLGASGTNYLTIWPGELYESPPLADATIILYIQASKSNETLEIELWTQ
jgi:hypothetical protein